MEEKRNEGKREGREGKKDDAMGGIIINASVREIGRSSWLNEGAPGEGDRVCRARNKRWASAVTYLLTKRFRKNKPRATPEFCNAKLK